MSAGGWVMALVLAATAAIVIGLLVGVARSIQRERTPGAPLGKEFSLSIILVVLFIASWVMHGIAEWQVFTDEQHAHGEAVKAGDFVADFMKSTLENWQSEFLQLFSFVVLAALYIHKGSAESRDSDDRVEAALERIERRLDSASIPGGRN